MKKNKKENLKEKFKYFKKPLIILSVIGNVLFLLFIIVGCVGVKKQQSNLNNKQVESTQVKRLKTRANSNLRVEDLVDTKWIINDFIGEIPINNVGQVSSDTNLSQNANITFSLYDSYSQIVYNKIKFYGTNSPTSSGLSGRLWYTNSSNNVDIAVYNFNSNQWTATDYKKIEITGGTSSQNTYLIDWFYNNATLVDSPLPDIPDFNEEDVVELIHIGDNFIPSAYVTQNGQFILNGFAGLHSQANTNTLHLDGFGFYSNGEYFNRIDLIYVPVSAGAPYCTQDGVTIIDTSSGYGNYLYCLAIQYKLVDNGTQFKSVTVASCRRTFVDNGDYQINCYDVRNPFIVWVNDSYRDLYVMEDSGAIISGEYLTVIGKSSTELLKITSSVSQSVMGYTNVITLLSTSFSGLKDFFGISILPGITLGLLMFLPLVVIIIIAVVRLLKK